jgi:hypothetical protein
MRTFVHFHRSKPSCHVLFSRFRGFKGRVCRTQSEAAHFRARNRPFPSFHPKTTPIHRNFLSNLHAIAHIAREAPLNLAIQAVSDPFRPRSLSLFSPFAGDSIDASCYLSPSDETAKPSHSRSFLNVSAFQSPSYS